MAQHRSAPASHTKSGNTSIVRRALGGALFAIASGLPIMASALPLFQAGVVVGTRGCPAVGALRCDNNESSTSAVSAGAGPVFDNFFGVDVAMDALARSGPGQLKAVANVGARTAGFVNSPAVELTRAGASFSLDDILITGPAGETVTFSFNIATSGGLTNEFDPTMFSAASVRVLYGIPSFGVESFGEATRTNGSLTASGAFANGDFSVTAATRPYTTRAGETITFSLQLDVSAAAGCGVFGCPMDRDAFASSGFLNTVGFPTIGPVANLPDGWTISSASGLIVDNRFVLPGSIPEPTSLALLAAGLAGFGFGRAKIMAPSSRG